MLSGTAPWVCPDTRLMAPTVDWPKVDAKKLSLMAKCWAKFHMAVTVLPSK